MEMMDVVDGGTVGRGVDGGAATRGEDGISGGGDDGARRPSARSREGSNNGHSSSGSDEGANDGSGSERGGGRGWVAKTASGGRRTFSPALAVPRRMNSVIKGQPRYAEDLGKNSSRLFRRATDREGMEGRDAVPLKRSESSVDVDMSQASDVSAASTSTYVTTLGNQSVNALKSSASAVELRALNKIKPEVPPSSSGLSHIGGQEHAKQREKPKTREEQRGNLGSEFVEAEYAEGVPDASFMKGATFRDFIILRELGRGLCGTVYLAKYRLTDQLVAFKVMRKQKLIDVGEIRHAVREREVHAMMNNGPFIDKLLHSYQDKWALYLVLEYAPCGDLFQAMNYHGLPTLQDAKIYTAQCALAIDYIHQCGYVYRDLKPENVLLGANGCVRLADFGMAKKLETADDRAYTICGTAQYMSPEVLTHRGCRFEADFWALGVLIYELCTGTTPFGGDKDSRQELYRRLLHHRNDTMTFPTWFNAETCSIVKSFLHEDESKRLDANQSFDHPWFASVSSMDVLSGAQAPVLQPRRRNIVYDMKLRESIAQGDVPWERGTIVSDPAQLALFESF